MIWESVNRIFFTSLKSIIIPDSVTRIAWKTFAECSSLTSITIPNSVTRIASDAFSGCTGLTSITIPDSVTEISYDAFYGCSSLTDVYYTGTGEQWNQITISSSGNDYFTAATKHYESTGE